MASNINETLGQSVVRGSADEQYRTFVRNGEKLRVQAIEYERFRQKLARETNEKNLKDEIDKLEKGSKKRKQLEEEYKRLQESNNEKAYDLLFELEHKKYEIARNLDKQRIDARRVETLRAEAEEAEAMYQTAKRVSDADIDFINKAKELRDQANKELFNAEVRQKKELMKQSKNGTYQEKIAALKAIREKYREEQRELSSLLKIKEKDRTEDQKERISQLKALGNDAIASGSTGLQAVVDWEGFGEKFASKIVGKVVENVTKTVDAVGDTITAYFEAQGRINARLQGSGSTYQQMTKIVSSTIGLSGYVSQKKVLDNIKKLVDEGIAYNVEQRAFLATISENIASTFDAANGTLLRLIRIQQADSTQARLGMEAFLTNFLNKMYSDTSYLNDLYDSVSAAIIDANSQLSRNQSLEFEYNIQKWLGSLSSLGASESAITNIATGINYLATGNVSALSSNAGLQTLLAMSANRAGISYGSLLTGGLQAKDTNDLLAEMVKYLQEIANQDNQVVKAAYANMFGLSLSDLRAIASLTKSDIENISKSSMTYDRATSELQSQMKKIPERVHLSTVMKTVYENYLGTVASDIGSSTGKYLTWMIADLLEQTVGGIPLPTVTVFGSGVDLNTSVAQMLKLGMVGYSTLSQLGTLVGSIGKRGNFDLSKFGFKEYTSRGTGVTSVARGAERFESSSMSLGSGFEESDVQSLTQESTAKAKEQVGSTEDDSISIKEIWDTFKKCLASEGGDSLRVTVVNSDDIRVRVTNDVFDPVNVKDTGMFDR